MRPTNTSPRIIELVAIACLFSFAIWRASGETPIQVQTVNETQTSWIPRVITNVIEVRIPTNIFINVYRTNRIEAVRSNVVNVYRTNWTDRTETRVIPVGVTRTNFVTRYETNLNTLTFTNWETVLVMKTNRVTQRVPNVVEIDLPAERPDAVKTTTPAKEAATPSATIENLALDTATTGKAAVDDLIEVSFKLKSADGTTPTLAAYEWRVERTDGSVLLFGQNPEFRRDLPFGTYKVEVKARAANNSAPVRVRGVVEVTADEATQNKPGTTASAR